MAAQGMGDEEDYAAFLERKYGLGAAGEDELASQWGTASTQADPYPEPPRPRTDGGPARPPAARSLAAMPSWQRLSRNRAAKLATADFTQHQHLSTMYHMHRRIAEMYAKSGLVQRGEGGGAPPGCGSACGGCASAASRPATSPYAAPGASRRAQASRPSTAPSSSGAQGLPGEAGMAVRVAGAAPASSTPPAPSYSKRRVQNTAAALKTAILDEIVANRIYEGQRLKALFRSYLKLNAAESFFPTLQQVIEELSVELGIRDSNRGAFGFVVLAEDTLRGSQVALKFIERGPQHINKYVEREIINHMKLRHPHIIDLQEVFITPTHLVLSMEYAAGGDLADFIRTRRGLSEDLARWFFQQLVIAVDYAHRMGVTSRDIKMENTLLDGSPRPLIKLADFGFSKDANAHSAPTSRVGTPAYLAPEVVSCQPGQNYDGKKADIWSCGVLLFAMTTDSFPFHREGDAYLKPNQKLSAMLQRILRGEYAFPPGRKLSEGVKDLIGRMLVLDPSKRASLQEVMAHRWYKEQLNPAALAFNDQCVAESQANQPPPEMLEEVRRIVMEASRPQGGAGAPDGSGGSGGRHGDSLDDLVRSVANEAVEDGGDWDWD
ncbi:hypothetical protein ABPG75_001245 [Micractinium tetrahymenae]